MVKRPRAEPSTGSNVRRRVEVNSANANTLEESGLEDSPIGDNGTRATSPQLSEDAEDKDDITGFKSDSDAGGMADDGDASDGSSEGSSLDDPDEDDYVPYSPPRPLRNAYDDLEGKNDEADASDGENDENDDFEQRDRALYLGAPITLNESMLSILSLTYTHNLSKSCLDDVLQLISIHCPPSNLCKDNLSLFKKHFNKTKSLVVRHYYCTTCFESLKDRHERCSHCNQHRDAAFFVEVPILPQLESIFKRPGFRQLLNHRFNRTKVGVGSYDDIYDGKVYKSLSDRGGILSDVNNISFMWYTDGVRISAANENEIWPFFLTINELPFPERTKPENVLLAGIWFGPHKPVPHLFLKGIREDFHSLNKGVQFKIPTVPEPVLVKGIVLCGTCDLSAKALFLNMSHRSSTFGCQKCKTRSVKKNNQVIYKFERYPQKRTYEETLQHAERAIKARRSVYGVKGTSALSFVYRSVETTAIDMHDGIIGVARVLNKIHFSEDHHKHPASLFGFLELYDKRLCAIRPPYYIDKIPRSYSSHGKVWKASELKVNLMIYSLPLLQDIMSVFHFEHHMLLVYGLYLLSRNSVTEEYIELATEMLTDYCSRFEDLYGAQFMTCHVHQLIHLPSVVRDLGPLWATSCAPFEGLNDTLRRFSLGNQQEETLVTSAASLFLHVSKMKPVQLAPGRPANAFCEKLSQGGKKVEVHSVYGHFCVVGKLRRCTVLPEVVYVALGPLKLSGCNFCVFDRILNTRRNILFSSTAHEDPSKSISSCVKYEKNNGHFYGRVHSYLRVTECDCQDVCLNCEPSLYAIIHKLHTQPAYRAEPGGVIPFIHRCAEMSEYEAVRVECLKCVCFLLEIEDRHDAFVVEPITTGSVQE